MGYYIYQEDAKFLLRDENRRKAFKALREQRQLSGRTLEEALEDGRWDAETDSESGDIIGIRFTREKSDYGEKETLIAIAPFVEEGSFIQMRGERGEHWQWRFTGISLQTVDARIVWPEW